MTHQKILAFPACWEQECEKALIKSLACRKTPIKIIKKIKRIVSGNNNYCGGEVNNRLGGCLFQVEQVKSKAPWKLRNFEILVIHDFILERTCEAFAYNSTWLASCVVIPIFITVLSPTLLSSHASPEGFQRYYRDFQPRRCRNTAFTAISLNNAPFPSSP